MHRMQYRQLAGPVENFRQQTGALFRGVDNDEN
jgi:hypothetical protein